MSVLAIDAGTTGVTALVISADGAVAGRGYQEFPQFYPEPGRPGSARLREQGQRLREQGHEPG